MALNPSSLSNQALPVSRELKKDAIFPRATTRSGGIIKTTSLVTSRVTSPPNWSSIISSHVNFNTTGFTQWRKLSELSDSDEDEKFLKEGWLDEPDFIDSYVESQGNGWTAHQIWGFVNVESDGKTVRKYGRRVVVKKGKNVIRARLFYNYIGPVPHK
jgi:hypothetical protein